MTVPQNRFNKRAAGKHLALLDPGADRFYFASFADDKGKDKDKAARPSYRNQSLGAAAEWIADRQMLGGGIHVCVQQMKGKKRGNDQVARIRALIGDFDDGLPEKWPLEPSLITETRPGRFHAYWFTDPDDPITPDDFTSMMKRLVESHRADPNAKDLARVLRLAGTWNLKPGRKPYLVNIVHESGDRYGRAVLLAAFPPVPNSEPVYEATKYEADENHERPDDALARRYRRRYEVGFAEDVKQLGVRKDGAGRHTELLGRAARWGQYVHHGIATPNEFEAGLLAACNANGLSKDDGRDDCARTIKDGLKRAANDRLEELRDRPRPSRSNGHAGNGAQYANGGTGAAPLMARPNGTTAHAVSTNRGTMVWPDTKKSGAPRPSQKNILAFFKWRGVKWQHNAFDLRTTATFDGTTHAFSDALEREMRLEADMLGLCVPRYFFEDVCLDAARKNTIHPVRDYLDGLKWDGTPRLSKWLTAYAGAEDTPLTRQFARKVLIAAVRRVRKPGVKFDTALVLESPQGTGKSSLIRTLAGPDWFTDTVPIGAETKVVIEQTAGAWLVEMAELSGIRRSEVEAVKAMLSRQTDRARLSYGRHAVDVPRQFILIGSVNPGTYLRDMTGNRRFWPVCVGTIDLKAAARDRDQLWAEAAHHEASGEALELPCKLWAAAGEEQEARLIADPWQEILAPLLEGKKGCVLTSTLWAKLKVESDRQDGNLGQRLAAIMTKLGFKRVRRRRDGLLVYGYTNAPDSETNWLFV